MTTWATKTLGDICEITSSKRIFAHEYVSDGVPFYRGKEIVEKFNGAQAPSTELFISRNRFEEIVDKHGAPREGDLLLTSVGTLGVPYLVGPGEEFYFKDGNLTWFRPGKYSDSAFLYYWLLTPQGRAELGKSTIGTSQSAYTIELLKKMRISLPAMAEQAELASVISAYDDLIENNRRRMALLEESARLLYREWFVRLRFPGHEHTRVIDGVPEGWERKSLGEVARLNETSLGGTFDGEIEYIDIASVTRNSVNETTRYEFRDAPSRARRVVNHGDIIWSCVRPNRRSHAVIWRPPENLIASTGFAVITPASLPTSFLYQAITTELFVGYLENHAKGAAYPAVVAGDFERAKVLVPTPVLTNAFNEFAEPLLSQAHNLQLQNRKLRISRDLLLPRLMSGEIAV